MSVEALSPAVIFAVVLGLISLGFGIYQSQKGAVPGQRAELQQIHAELTRQNLSINAELAIQKGIVETLQRQGYETWRKQKELEESHAKLKTENEQLKALTNEQAMLITALQRQLTGLARGNIRTGNKLRQILTEKMSEEELKAWAFDLNVPLEQITSNKMTLSALVIAVLKYLEQYGQLDEALYDLRRRRPDLALEETL